LAPAKFSSIDRGPNSGQAVVKVESQTGAIAFDVHFALEGTGGVLGSWTTMTLTSSKKVIVSGLTPAGTNQFQVRALGKLGYTDWSPSMTFIAAYRKRGLKANGYGYTRNRGLYAPLFLFSVYR
jgi:hypothetical protein